MKRQQISGAARFLGETFAPLLVFWAIEHTLGLVAAIVGGIAIGVVLVGLQIKRDRRVSPFTVFVAASVVGFGLLDLHYRSSFFVKLEPALGNALTGVFFVGSVLWGAPVIIEFAERSLGRKLRARRYLTIWTLLWGGFFFLRAGAHVWMAYNVSLDRALLIRGLVGPLSFAFMIGAEMAVRYLFYGKRGFDKSEPEPAAAPSDQDR